mmetsp:Transcript_101969/g.263546  ORF Transcript_101969/g.263546 Transcript_101969/m.263546 type:complete len:383 (-) Transcript_101969:2-1150(-)
MLGEAKPLWEAELSLSLAIGAKEADVPQLHRPGRELEHLNPVVQQVRDQHAVVLVHDHVTRRVELQAATAPLAEVVQPLVSLTIDDLHNVVGLVRNEDEPARAVEVDARWVSHKPLDLGLAIRVHPQLLVLRGRAHDEVERAPLDILLQAVLGDHRDPQAELPGRGRDEVDPIPPVLKVLYLEALEVLRARDRGNEAVAAHCAALALAVVRSHPQVGRVVHLQDAERRSLRRAPRGVGRGLGHSAKLGHLVKEVIAKPKGDDRIRIEEEQVGVMRNIGVLAGGRRAGALADGSQLFLQRLDLVLTHAIHQRNELLLALLQGQDAIANGRAHLLAGSLGTSLDLVDDFADPLVRVIRPAVERVDASMRHDCAGPPTRPLQLPL